MFLSPRRNLTKCGLFFGLLVPLAVAGCTSSTATVTGKVTYKGAPLKGGTVIFLSTQGKGSSNADIGEDGTYTAEKVPVGDVKICVNTAFLKPNRSAHTYSPPPGQAAPGYDPSKGNKGDRYVAIPPDYADPDKTSLTLTVTGGKQEHPIELK